MPKSTFFNLPDNKKKKIIETTYDIFIEEDYENVNIRNFTNRAGISIGSFYQYFEDKDDLYLYLMSEIEKKIIKRQKEKTGFYLTNRTKVPIEEICTPIEIEFNRTWYKVPIGVMMKFYFGKYCRELNESIYDELVELKRKNRLVDNVDINFAFYMYTTSMFNILIYFRENNITVETEKNKIKNNFYMNWFLKNIIISN